MRNLTQMLIATLKANNLNDRKLDNETIIEAFSNIFEDELKFFSDDKSKNKYIVHTNLYWSEDLYLDFKYSYEHLQAGLELIAYDYNMEINVIADLIELGELVNNNKIRHNK